MNLHGIVSGAIGTVNPHIPGVLRSSAGYTTEADGTQVPAYAAPVTVMLQVQALTWKDLQQISGLNIQGEARAVYLNGDWRGVIRADQKGGDLLAFDGKDWLAAHVLEQWPDWTKLVAVRQL